MKTIPMIRFSLLVGALGSALLFATPRVYCQAPPTGQFAAIYRGTATYTVTSYTTTMPLAQPMRFKFVDTFYFIQYSTNADYTNAAGTGAIAPLADSTAPNNSIAGGDAAPTMNHYSLIYFTSGKHPFSTGAGSVNGDFDLGYDCPFVGVNPPGSGGGLSDLYHVSVGAASYLAKVPAGEAVQPGGTFVCLPILSDTSTNEIGGNANLDNRRTQTLSLFGSVSAKARTMTGSFPLATIGGGNFPPAGGAAFAPAKYAGIYSALSIFNGGTEDETFVNPYRDPFNTGLPNGNEFNVVPGVTVNTVTGKWDVKLDAKLTGFANNNTRFINAAAVGVYTGSGRADPNGAVAANVAANAGAGMSGDGSQFAAEAVVFEFLLGGAKPKVFQGAFPYTLAGFNGNVPNLLATPLF